MPRPRRPLPLACAALASLVLGCGAKMSPKTGASASDTKLTARPAGDATDSPRADAPASSGGAKPRGSAKPEPQPAPAVEPPAPVEPGRLAGITAAHNRAREELGLPPLSWSPELARYAQSWADTLKRRNCALDHRPRKGPDAQRYGENLFAAMGAPADASMVVDRWLAEVKDYDARTGRCRGVCGHYTQVVWRKSERLGCGMATCGDTEVWVCNYDPPGNFMGERPY